MTVVNPFYRVDMNNTMGGAAGTFGQWNGATVNVSATTPNGSGLPLDWWVRGSSTGVIENGFRKGTSTNMFTVSILNATDGAAADIGYRFDWGDGTITWTDGPTGNVSGSTTWAHSIEGPNGQGAGFRIVVPNVPAWPDSWLLKVWARDYPARRMRYKASLDDTKASTDELWLDQTVPGPGPNGLNDDYTDFCTHPSITHEIVFASDETGRTLTFDMTRTYQYWPTIYAVALFKAANVPDLPRGARRAQAAVQTRRPA